MCVLLPVVPQESGFSVPLGDRGNVASRLFLPGVLGLFRRMKTADRLKRSERLASATISVHLDVFYEALGYPQVTV